MQFVLSARDRADSQFVVEDAANAAETAAALKADRWADVTPRG